MEHSFWFCNATYYGKVRATRSPSEKVRISALYIKPKKELHGDYWIKVCSDLPNTTTCVKLTSAKAKIRMLKDGKLVKHKSNRDNDQNIKTRKHPCEREKSWQTMTHWMNKHELKRWHVFEKKKKKTISSIHLQKMHRHWFKRTNINGKKRSEHNN